LSFRTDLLHVVDEVRALRGPSPGLDIQTVALTIVRRTWSGGRRGAGTATDVILTALPMRYKIRGLSEKQIASSGGRLEAGDVKVGPITPSYPGGGVTPDQLKPSGTTGGEVIHILTGASAGEYTVVDIDTMKAFSYFLTLRRTST
jgi:hypothetical protein